MIEQRIKDIGIYSLETAKMVGSEIWKGIKPGFLGVKWGIQTFMDLNGFSAYLKAQSEIQAQIRLYRLMDSLRRHPRVNSLLRYTAPILYPATPRFSS